VCLLNVCQSLTGGLYLCRTLGNTDPVANLLLLEIGNGVMSDLMFGTLLPSLPRKVSGKVTTRVTLEVVVEFTDVIPLRHGDVRIR